MVSGGIMSPAPRKKISQGKSNKIGVFFSHTWQKPNQKRFVELIIDIMRKDRRVTPIIAERNFPTGLSWKDMYDKIIKEERAVVVFFFSPGFLYSDSCMFEFNEACQLLHPMGVPLLPVMLKRCKIPAPFGGDKSYLDMKSLYAGFKKVKGDIRRDSKLYQGIETKVAALISDIVKRVQDYWDNVHVYRISDADDRLFEESKTLYESYPKDYRDKFDSINQWIGEAGNFELSEYVHELYYIAYFRRAPVGIIYGSHYPSSRVRNGFCYINPFIIKKDIKNIDHGRIADTLMAKVMGDVRTTDIGEPRFLFELPFKDDEDKSTLDHCFRGWEKLPAKYSLEYFEDIGYKSPEVTTFIESGKDADPSEMHLMALNLYGANKTITKKLFVSTILEPVYNVYHTEGFFDPFFLRDWIRYLDDIRDDIEKDLPEKIKVIKINPKRLRSTLKAYE